MENLRKKTQDILNVLGYPDAELSILIVDDPNIAIFNKQYLQKDLPTNVISFPMQEGGFSEINPNLLGDVVISADTCERECIEAGILFGDRLIQLLVHGILHLVGYDHIHSRKEADRMEKKTNEILKHLGQPQPISL